MLEDFNDLCREGWFLFSMAGLILLAAMLPLSWRDEAQNKAAFYAAHQCHDIPRGYVCADGAVRQ